MRTPFGAGETVINFLLEEESLLSNRDAISLEGPETAPFANLT